MTRKETEQAPPAKTDHGKNETAPPEAAPSDGAEEQVIEGEEQAILELPEEPPSGNANAAGAPHDGLEPDPAEELLIAGIGASAGGLEAATRLLEAMTPNANVALVLVQHLPREYESALPALLAARTRLPVVEIRDGMRVEGGRVYVMPHNVQMVISDGMLRLSPRPPERTQHWPIDLFFRSLAAHSKARAVGIVLSGTGSDGAEGLLEIKAFGGLTIAQSPESAAFDGMPRAAIATGRVDLVLDASDIAHELVGIATHPLLLWAKKKVSPEDEFSEPELTRVFALLHASSGVDFQSYKRPTIARRILRRMVLHKLTQIPAYIRLLEQSPPEVQSLYQDMLINVTLFFREPQSFEALAKIVYPAITSQQKPGQPIRVWVAACSTGEEAYSVAMSLLDFLGNKARGTTLQIFATDLSENAIEHARAGLYSDAIAADIPPERLSRYFSQVDGGYRIHRSVRDLCVFARQDLTRDPPFSKLDLILCRNVLIYMSASLQKKLIQIFHYALKPRGYLMLGQAETIGTGIDFFSIADKRYRIYAKRLGDTARLNLSVGVATQQHSVARKLGGPGSHDDRTIQQEADQAMLDRFAPPGVVVDADLQIVQFRGRTGAFLQPAPGEPSHNLLKMARDGLLYGTRKALHEARKSGKPVRSDGHRVQSERGARMVDVEVVPLRTADRLYFLVLFYDAASEAPPPPQPAKKGGEAPDPTIEELQRELQANREHLQSMIQELEAANEELQSANEEVLSSNEELQSMNEELDTAKEELQSTNEELTTVNDELHGRNEELRHANTDLVNLLTSVQIAIVIVARDLRIRRFTPMAERVLNLIPGDVGRPIGHIKPNVECSDLEALTQEAIDTTETREREVRDRQGKWYSLQARPYENAEGRVEGAVITLFDIDAVKRQESSRQEKVLTRQALAFARATIASLRQPLCVLDRELRVQSVNSAFTAAFDLPAESAVGHFLYELGDGQWNDRALREKLSELLPDGQKVHDGPMLDQGRKLEGFALSHRDAKGRVCTLSLSATLIPADEERVALVLLAFDESRSGEERSAASAEVTQ